MRHIGRQGPITGILFSILIILIIHNSRQSETPICSCSYEKSPLHIIKRFRKHFQIFPHFHFLPEMAALRLRLPDQARHEAFYSYKFDQVICLIYLFVIMRSNLFPDLLLGLQSLEETVDLVLDRIELINLSVKIDQVFVR
jgi:hypothetical protein